MTEARIQRRESGPDALLPVGVVQGIDDVRQLTLVLRRRSRRQPALRLRRDLDEDAHRVTPFAAPAASGSPERHHVVARA